MRLLSLADSAVAWAPAKVNLFLEVLRKRPDGYHDLATLMLAVNLFDTLVFQSAPESVALTSNRPDLSTGHDNLIVRAAHLLQQHVGRPYGAKIRLIKRIPMQGGLGGGSSDAAATLLALDRLWDLHLGKEELADLGARLGSDVPFFLKADAAWCTGRGEIVAPVQLGPALHLVVVSPPFGCSTAEVYRRLQTPPETTSSEATPSGTALSTPTEATPVAGFPRPPARPESTSLPRALASPGASLPHRTDRAEAKGDAPGLANTLAEALAQGDIDAISHGLHNRLSASAQELAPRLTEYLDKLRRLGALGTLVSGSGSSVFGLCRGRNEAKDLARAYARGPLDKNDKVFVVRSCVSPLPP